MNVHRYDDRLRDVLLQVKWPVLVWSVTDPAGWDALAAAKADHNPFVVFRCIPDGANADNAGVDPELLALQTAAAIKGHEHLVDAVQGYNELVRTNPDPEHIARELGYVRACHHLGFKVLGCVVPVGNLEPADLERVDVQRLIAECDFWGYGAYVRPDYDVVSGLLNIEEGNYARRPDMWAVVLHGRGLDHHELLGKLILRETGTYAGWTDSLTPGLYGHLLAEIDAYADLHGIGKATGKACATSPFTLTAYNWAGFEFIDYPEVLARLAGRASVVNAGGSWVQPDAPAPTTTPKETPMTESTTIPYGFAEMESDGFKDLAAELGPATVGEPYAAAYYLGDRTAFQHCTNGLMVATKDDAGNWHSDFLPFA